MEKLKYYKKFINENKGTFTKFEDMFKNSSYAQDYDKLDNKFNNWYLDSARSLANLANIKNGDTILELGAGTGFATQELLKRVGNGNIIATEYGDGMYGVLKNKFEHYDNIECYQLDARNLWEFINNKDLIDNVDLVFTNFTYFYFYDFEKELYKNIYNCLTENGKYVFNITNFLTSYVFNGKEYNTFGNKLDEGFDKFLKKKGYNGIGEPNKFIKDDEYYTNVKSKLTQSGFKTVIMEPYSMPFSPSQALDFMIDGFYKHGSSVTWSSTLNNLPLEKRLELLKEGKEYIKEYLDSSNDNPTIINVLAQK